MRKIVTICSRCHNLFWTDKTGQGWPPWIGGKAESATWIEKANLVSVLASRNAIVASAVSLGRTVTFETNPRLGERTGSVICILTKHSQVMGIFISVHQDYGKRIEIQPHMIRRDEWQN